MIAALTTENGTKQSDTAQAVVMQNLSEIPNGCRHNSADDKERKRNK